MTTDRIDALRQALRSGPENNALRILLAEELVAAGQRQEALAEYEIVLAAAALPDESLVQVGSLALDEGQRKLAMRCLEEARKKGVVEGLTALQTSLGRVLSQDGVVQLTRSRSARSTTESLRPESTLLFDAIAGLQDVKKVIHRMIILPFRRPELYARFGRRSGGGVMLYGPPGCGKTMLARATAGECDLPFFNVRIEEILSPYIGESERNLHAAFEEARANAPGVVFLDELDALAFARRKHHGGAARALVDQLLQELDSMGAENKDLLVLGATNAPWDVDDALQRPGRLGRRIFVPPPDATARQHLIETALKERPQQDIDVKHLARKTPLFSGADLASVIEQAIDGAIEDSLESEDEVALTMAHFEQALSEIRPSTLDWLQRAQNYVEFSNRGERYKDIEKYLRSAEVRKARPT
jgi:SpoVK/Ycf46/Vps4 family AAA+-type ATPase